MRTHGGGVIESLVRLERLQGRRRAAEARHTLTDALVAAAPHSSRSVEGTLARRLENNPTEVESLHSRKLIRRIAVERVSFSGGLRRAALAATSEGWGWGLTALPTTACLRAL